VVKKDTVVVVLLVSLRLMRMGRNLLRVFILRVSTDQYQILVSVLVPTVRRCTQAGRELLGSCQYRSTECWYLSDV
jgi:hypothetical protein